MCSVVLPPFQHPYTQPPPPLPLASLLRPSCPRSRDNKKHCTRKTQTRERGRRQRHSLSITHLPHPPALLLSRPLFSTVMYVAARPVYGFVSPSFFTTILSSSTQIEPLLSASISRNVSRKCPADADADADEYCHGGGGVATTASTGRGGRDGDGLRSPDVQDFPASWRSFTQTNQSPNQRQKSK